LTGLKNIVIAIDGPSGSGKSTISRRLARELGFVYVDTGAMYRTLAWHCLQKGVNVEDPKAVAGACRRWKTELKCEEGEGRLLVDGYYPSAEIRTAATSAAVPQVAAVPKVRDWMKKTQRDCIRFGNLVMEGRDIGTNVFPETDFKYFLDAPLDVRKVRREAEGVREDLAARDQRDSQRRAAPLMIPLGARIIHNTGTAEQTAAQIIADFRLRAAGAARARDASGTGGPETGRRSRDA
jgi:cytidylate kinase